MPLQGRRCHRRLPSTLPGEQPFPPLVSAPDFFSSFVGCGGEQAATRWGLSHSRRAVHRTRERGRLSPLLLLPRRCCCRTRFPVCFFFPSVPAARGSVWWLHTRMVCSFSPCQDSPRLAASWLIRVQSLPLIDEAVPPERRLLGALQLAPTPSLFPSLWGNLLGLLTSPGRTVVPCCWKPH